MKQKMAEKTIQKAINNRKEQQNTIMTRKINKGQQNKGKHIIIIIKILLILSLINIVNARGPHRGAHAPHTGIPPPQLTASLWNRWAIISEMDKPSL